MKRMVCVGLVLGIGLLAMAAASHPAVAKDTDKAKQERVFELRKYITNPGKLEALHKRFREHTLRLFKKHGIEVVGFWTPKEGPESKNTLIYIVAFPSVEAKEKAWKEFQADPEWQKAKEESHKDGVIVGKVESTILVPTDYSTIK